MKVTLLAAAAFSLLTASAFGADLEMPLKGPASPTAFHMDELLRGCTRWRRLGANKFKRFCRDHRFGRSRRLYFRQY